jgi:hypothetical protein
MPVSMSAAHPLFAEIMGEWVSIIDSLFLNPLVFEVRCLAFVSLVSVSRSGKGGGEGTRNSE